MPEVTIEITDIDGDQIEAEAQVHDILESLVDWTAYEFKIDLRPCIYAAVLDSPSRWNATVKVEGV